jgi:hypothetical protein
MRYQINNAYAMWVTSVAISGLGFKQLAAPIKGRVLWFLLGWVSIEIKQI